MTAITLFASTFALVFVLGLQSLVVNAGHRWLAFANSFAIGTANLVLFKLAPDAAGLDRWRWKAGYCCSFSRTPGSGPGMASIRTALRIASRMPR